jgi:hypothetical protein
MEITAQVLAGVPGRNIHIPLADFAAVWRLAETELSRLLISAWETDWEPSYALAVVGTCRWLANAEELYGRATAPIQISGLPVGPADRQTIQAVHEESRYLMSRFPGGYESPGMPPRPGYLEGVREAVEWAWLLGPRPRVGVPHHDSV